MFPHPADLTLIRHITLHDTQSWGGTGDAAFKRSLLDAANLSERDAAGYVWFAFSIRITLSSERRSEKPDIENFPKLIVDAFTGTLYPHDDLTHVRGIQVEGAWSTDPGDERTEVWVWGKKA